MKPRLLFFCSDYNVGLTQALSEQAVEINRCDELNSYFISSPEEMEPGLHQWLKDEKLPLTIIDGLDKHQNFKILSRQIEDVIKREKITHVNVHNNWQLALVSWIKYRKIIPQKFKIIYTIHGYRHNSPLKTIPAIAIIGTALFLTADRVISMSTYVSNKFRLLKYKTDLVFYMMNQPQFNKKENIIDSSPLRLVFPAQFRHGKQQEMIIEAVAEYVIRTSDRTIRVVLPGAGPTQEGIRRLAVEKGIENLIEFPGKLPLDKVWEEYEKSNVAIISSNVETYGRCIAEPFALGRCVVTRPTGVALDIIRDGENGFFFKNSAQLADTLVDLHNNPQKLMATAGQAFIDKSIFHRDAVLASYISAINKA